MSSTGIIAIYRQSFETETFNLNAIAWCSYTYVVKFLIEIVNYMVPNELSGTFLPTKLLKHFRKGKLSINSNIKCVRARSYAL